jgi:predicted Zn-dependent protease
MKLFKKIMVIAGVVAFILNLVPTPPVSSITVKEEEDLGRKVLGSIFRQVRMVDDPDIVTYVNKIGRRILSHISEQPFRYHFYVIEQEAYNAFATPGGHIFVYTGLLAAMQEEEELAGILGHEIAHVTARHISQKIERSKKLQVATLAGMAAGVLMGMAGGGAAASAVTTGSMAAGASIELAYSRENEIQADQLGLEYLSNAGYSAEGLLKILKKIRSKTWFGKDIVPTYLMTHPAVEDRITYIGSYLDRVKGTAAAKPKVNPEEFDRIHTRVVTRYSDERVVLSEYEAAVAKKPGDPMAHYHYGLILARVGQRAEAIEQIKKALEKRAFDPYILRDLGTVYFLDGKYPDAINAFEGACSMIPSDADCLFYWGRTYLETGQFKQASESFSTLIKQYRDYAQAYYFYSQSLGKEGKVGEAYYWLGIYYWRNMEYKKALLQLKRAEKLVQDPEKRKKIEEIVAKAEKRLGKSSAKRPG